MAKRVLTLSVASDNYTYCIISGNNAVVIDAASDKAVLAIIKREGFFLDAIVSTHHHPDHVGGNSALKARTGCTIIGGDNRIPGIDRLVGDREIIAVGAISLQVIAAPGHTRGSIMLYEPDCGALFTGDTLFYAGCGRLLEGNASELYESIEKVKKYPSETTLYCGHNYTLNNLEFAHVVEPANKHIADRLDAQRAAAFPGTDVEQQQTAVTLAEELATNPFLRVNEKEVRRYTGLPKEPADKVFAALRRGKDRF